MTIRHLSAVAVVAAALAAPAALATTTPTTNNDIRVNITDSSLNLTRHLYARDATKHGALRVLRGLHVTFIVHNLGSRPHAFYLGGLQTKPVPPGGETRLRTWMRERGKISYRVLPDGTSAQQGVLYVY
jgi:hypothetical protein